MTLPLLLQAAGEMPWFRTVMFYKNLHLFGLFLAFASLGGVAIHAANGGTKAASGTRMLTASVFGLGMLFAMAGGFGQAARLGLTSTSVFPGWLWMKLALWVVVAVLSILPYRIPALAKPVYLLVPVLGGLAAYLAIYHPF
jgi:hypothetical protein